MTSGIYKHYKGGYYFVIGRARHSEKDEDLIIYVSLDATQPGPRLRARPSDGPNGFCTKVLIREEWVERFVYVGQEIESV